MGTTLPQDIKIAGHSPRALKDALKAFYRTGNRTAVLDLRSVFPNSADAAILFEEMIERGLVNLDAGFHHEDRLTKAGMAVAVAKGKRTPIGTADRVLDELLDRVDEQNRDPGTLFLIDEVWLYGSALRREETVGDLDIALDRSKNPALEDRASWDKRIRELRQLAPASFDYTKAMDWVFEPKIYGKRRNPLLTGLDETVDNLIEMAVPCRLIYDRARGGRVNDPILEKHPKAGRRHDRFGAPRTLPNLGAIDAIPAVTDAGWLRRPKSPNVAISNLFGRQFEEIDLKRAGHRVFKERDEVHLPWTPVGFKRRKGVDGRGTVILAYEGSLGAASATLYRSVSAADDGVKLTSRIRDVETGDPNAVTQVAILAGLILATDVHRQWQRLGEHPGKCGQQISVEVDNTALAIADCRAFDRSFMFWLTRLEKEHGVDLGQINIDGLLLSADEISAATYMRDIDTVRWDGGSQPAAPNDGPRI